MIRGGWTFVVFLATVSVSTFPFTGAEECSLVRDDGVAGSSKGVAVPALQCATFRDQAGPTNVVDASTLGAPNATVCCPVFRSEPNCGRVSAWDGDFSHDSRETQLDQFPWAAVVMTRWSRRTVCSGSLITREFVLSAAHCYVKTRKNKPATMYRVLLGEWDLALDEDCKYVRGRAVCNEQPPVEMLVERLIAHERYDPRRQDYLHDIALLKLRHPVEYGALIGPACLPDWSAAGASPVPEIAGQNFTATGWGRTRSFGTFQRKLKLDMRGRNVSECRQAYSLRAPEVAQVQLCVGTDPRRDVCYGDSGGALMRREVDRWVQVGIISFGAARCGRAIPGVYTNVAWYMDWIKRAIDVTHG